MIAFNKYYNKFNILSISLVILSLLFLLVYSLGFLWFLLKSHKFKSSGSNKSNIFVTDTFLFAQNGHPLFFLFNGDDCHT